MSTFVGGKLNLKGGPPKGGIKKKKRAKKVEGSELVAGGGGGASAQQDEAQAKVTPEGVVLDPSKDASADRRTDAEKRAEAHMLQYEELRLKKAAGKSHQEKIKEFNEKLAAMTEHNDIFRISYTA